MKSSSPSRVDEIVVATMRALGHEPDVRFAAPAASASDRRLTLRERFERAMAAADAEAAKFDRRNTVDPDYARKVFPCY